jgi:hypothetical protein
VSNALAVAAATATIRNLLLFEVPHADTDLSDLEVTTQPPDVARKGITKAQLNLFLYQTQINAGWRNFDMPRQVRPGETGSRALALNLHYLVTAYGRGDSDNDGVSHRVLGGAMSVLHDHPLLLRSDIRMALPGNDLADQFEPLKVTPLAMTVDEISKLWMVFMTQYRISAAYEVTVLLIDSRAGVRSPLPVLTRGHGDHGWPSAPGGAPELHGVRPPAAQPAARLGDDVVVTGAQLVVTAHVRFTSARGAPPVLVAPSGGDDSELTVHLSDVADDPGAWARWAPGLYSVALVVQSSGGPAVASNEVPVALAPRITVAPTATAAGTVALTVTCQPRIAAGQRVLLVFGDRQAEAGSITTPGDPAQPTTVTFTVSGVVAGSYVVRLRVDGVDSIPVVATGTPPVPSFDPAQTVVVA